MVGYMAQYSAEVLQEIKDKLLVSEVVSQYTTLERRGNNYWCKCPIHGEKTPSLQIRDDKGTWHCFGCGKGGSIFTFIQEMEKCSFPEAVRILAKRANVELAEMTFQQKKENDMREALFELYDRIAMTFHYLLLKDKRGQKARDYLSTRKVSPQMWEIFNLGYALDDGDFLYSFLKNKSYSDDLLNASGLFSKNNSHYPLFRDRLMFPVRSWQGRTVAFSGRDLGGQSLAKYINTPETPIYSKKHNLFGLYESLETLKDKDKGGQAILCEGNFDVVALHQSGLTYAMAPLGTAFTIEQAKLLKRYCNSVTLLFDSDEAGQNATAKALSIAQGLELQNTVSKLTLGKDPSEVVQNMGEEALRNELLEKKTGFSYLVQNAVNRYDTKSSNGKFAVFKTVKPYLDATESNIVRSDLINVLSEVLEVPQTAILQDFYKGKLPVEKVQVAHMEKTLKQLVPSQLNIDFRTMLYVVNNRTFYDKVRIRLHIEDLEDDEAKKLYQVLEDAKREGVQESNEYILQMIDDKQLASDVANSFSMEEFIREPEKNLNEALNRITIRNLEAKLRNCRNMLELSELNGDQDYEKILNEFNMLNQKIILLNEELKRNTQ